MVIAFLGSMYSLHRFICHSAHDSNISQITLYRHRVLQTERDPVRSSAIMRVTTSDYSDVFMAQQPLQCWGHRACRMMQRTVPCCGTCVHPQVARFFSKHLLRTFHLQTATFRCYKPVYSPVYPCCPLRVSRSAPQLCWVLLGPVTRHLFGPQTSLLNTDV